METPLSTSRRITRSLAAASAHKDPTTHFSRTKNAAGERSALHDITNDSPIVGLAAGGLHADKTPVAKTRPRPRRTPGSGEALLRGQVKTLLQKVDEESCAAAVRPARIQALLGVSRSPAQLLAPTPANTPHLGTVSAAREDFLLPDALMMMPCVLEEEELLPKLQVIAAASLPPPPPAEENLGECQLKRALVFDDSPRKSDLSGGSVVWSSLTFQGSSSDRSPDDDSSSAWSIQVHASSEKGDDELGEDAVGELEEECTEDEWRGEDDGCFDDLCEGMGKMTVGQDEEEEVHPVGLPAFEGRHTRFIYNSDDEMEREEVVVDAAADHGALVLRGLPVPEGKHLRFHEEDEE